MQTPNRSQYYSLLTDAKQHACEATALCLLELQGLWSAEAEAHKQV